jgi:hypothetical protein
MAREHSLESGAARWKRWKSLIDDNAERAMSVWMASLPTSATKWPRERLRRLGIDLDAAIRRKRRLRGFAQSALRNTGKALP